MKLTINQKDRLSDFLANIGVAWFAGGIIAPFFTFKNLTEIIIPGLWGLFLAIIFISLSLNIRK
jgi:hypothetical protein